MITVKRKRGRLKVRWSNLSDRELDEGDRGRPERVKVESGKKKEISI